MIIINIPKQPSREKLLFSLFIPPFCCFHFSLQLRVKRGKAQMKAVEDRAGREIEKKNCKQTQNVQHDKHNEITDVDFYCRLFSFFLLPTVSCL
jgi:hypothetical protein